MNLQPQHLRFVIDREIDDEYTISDLLEDHINVKYDARTAIGVIRHVIERMEAKLQSLECSLFPDEATTP